MAKGSLKAVIDAVRSGFSPMLKDYDDFIFLSTHDILISGKSIIKVSSLEEKDRELEISYLFVKSPRATLLRLDQDGKIKVGFVHPNAREIITGCWSAENIDKDKAKNYFRAMGKKGRPNNLRNKKGRPYRSQGENNLCPICGGEMSVCGCDSSVD